MNSDATSIKEYLESVPEERKPAFNKLRNTINKNIPKGFVEQISYGFPGFVVPHSLYPAGYHVTPELPLPFLGIASQKNFIALYHYGIYTNPKLYKWWVREYPKHCNHKLDMGKSCIRLKKIDEIPYNLIGELVRKLTVDDYIKEYDKQIKRKD
ncbi:MAG: DUF1801 domain-containing protein [Bacteroidetes bacterium]|nr:DUF1801 domain-containing protein [Bacteroidota bacterium]